jgi:hypothetical protein
MTKINSRGKKRFNWERNHHYSDFPPPRRGLALTTLASFCCTRGQNKKEPTFEEKKA